jgi:flavin-dependent dehydrogenase
VTREVDVCVLGGGPAGSSLAASLAQSGNRVAVVEQRLFPRSHVGESLSAGVWPLLDSLGVSRSTVEALGVRVTEAGVRWRTEVEERVPVADSLTVDRGRFDAVLLDHARSTGTAVLHGRAHRPERTASGWRVPLAEDSVFARFLADASGRRRVLGGRRHRTSPPMVALHARWRTEWSASGPQMRILAIPDGWLWCARLPAGEMRVMAFVDAERLTADRVEVGSVFRELVTSAPEMTSALETVPRAAKMQVCDASSYRLEEVMTLDAIRVGEAAFGIDPLSSSGVQAAIQTGLAGAAAVHCLLSSEGDTSAGLEYYTEQVRSSSAFHARTAGRLYGENRRHADRPFWSRRALLDEQPRDRERRVAVGELLPCRVRLRRPAELRETACRVGERIERRLALHSPELDRPVAFLAGAWIAPLLTELAAAPSLAEARRRWERSMPSERAGQILCWLVERGLLEPVDSLPAGNVGRSS